MAIKYTKVNKEFATKKKANDFVNNVLSYDRVYIKKEGTKYFVYKFSFPKTTQIKIRAIANYSKYTFKILDYHEVAAKPLSYINSAYKKLDL